MLYVVVVVACLVFCGVQQLRGQRFTAHKDSLVPYKYPKERQQDSQGNQATSAAARHQVAAPPGGAPRPGCTQRGRTPARLCACMVACVHCRGAHGGGPRSSIRARAWHRIERPITAIGHLRAEVDAALQVLHQLRLLLHAARHAARVPLELLLPVVTAAVAVSVRCRPRGCSGDGVTCRLLVDAHPGSPCWRCNRRRAQIAASAAGSATREQRAGSGVPYVGGRAYGDSRVAGCCRPRMRVTARGARWGGEWFSCLDKTQEMQR
jgi:hypothetical protein